MSDPKANTVADVIKGIVAGGVATAAASVLILAQSASGVLPQINLIQLLQELLDAPKQPAIAWGFHFLIGAGVGGGFFAFIEPRLGVDSHTKGGILFGVISWLAMMLLLLPAVGGGYFGFQLSLLTPVLLLAFNVLYGAVLGFTYGKLSPSHDYTHALL